MADYSVRRYLLKRLLWPFIAIILLGMAVAYFFALRAATDATDLGLLDDAADLAEQVEVHQGKIVLELPPAAKEMLAENNGDQETYAIWDSKGVLISGDSRLMKLDAPTLNESQKFIDLNLNDEKNRAVILRRVVKSQTLFIAVAQTKHQRNRMSREIFIGLLMPEILLLLTAIAVIILGVRRGLCPIDQLRDDIISRSPNDLSHLDEASAPAELRPIIQGLNKLLDKLSIALSAHRRFIADAAHQLRTPLAALSSQIEVNMERSSTDTGVMLHQLLATTRRTSHLANQLLSLAKLEHTEHAACEKLVLDLQEEVREAAADMVIKAARKNIDINFNLQPCKVKGNSTLLRELMVNLFENAIRYAPQDGQINVDLHAEGECCVLAIEDNGPGVAESELGKLGMPFYRPASSQSEGCGLGLAIVKEIARLHDAQVDFAKINLSGGFRATLRAPAWREGK